MDTISVLIADDHELVRYALRTLLEAEPGIVVIGEASDSEGAISGCVELCPQVLLLDLRMPGIGGVKVCREVRSRCPDTSVLVLTSFDEEEEVFGVLSAGACGYILKDTRPERIVQAIRATADGHSVFDTSVANRIISGRTSPPNGLGPESEPLSEREMEVLKLLAEGLSNKEIGRSLWIGETTVKTHVSHILRKLGVVDRTQAVLVAVRAGLVPLES
jgi:NarL family two-component system response regulator LiaR